MAVGCFSPNVVLGQRFLFHHNADHVDHQIGKL
jgi:hypothetical protein